MLKNASKGQFIPLHVTVEGSSALSEYNNFDTQPMKTAIQNTCESVFAEIGPYESATDPVEKARLSKQLVGDIETLANATRMLGLKNLAEMCSNSANLFQVEMKDATPLKDTCEQVVEDVSIDKLPRIVISNGSVEQMTRQISEGFERIGGDPKTSFFKTSKVFLPLSEEVPALPHAFSSPTRGDMHNEIKTLLAMATVQPGCVPNINATVVQKNAQGNDEIVGYFMQLMPEFQKGSKGIGFLLSEKFDLMLSILDELARVLNSFHKNGITHNDIGITIGTEVAGNQFYRIVQMHNFILGLHETYDGYVITVKLFDPRLASTQNISEAIKYEVFSFLGMLFSAIRVHQEPFLITMEKSRDASPIGIRK